MLLTLWRMFEREPGGRWKPSWAEWLDDTATSLHALVTEGWHVGLGLPDRHQFLVTPWEFWPAVLSPLDSCGFIRMCTAVARNIFGGEPPLP